MLWNCRDDFERKYMQAVGNEKATSLVFDGLQCSSSEVADELLDFLAFMVAESRLQVLRFKNNSFKDVMINQSSIQTLVNNAA